MKLTFKKASLMFVQGHGITIKTHRDCLVWYKTPEHETLAVVLDAYYGGPEAYWLSYEQHTTNTSNI